MRKCFLACLCAALTILTASAQPADHQVSISLKRMIERNHYSPRAVDDSFSSYVFNKVISDLQDPQLLFTQTEYDVLTTYRYHLDEELNGKSWKFLAALTNATTRASLRADSIVTIILQKPLDLSADEKVTLSNDKTMKFPQSVSELRQAWNRKLKWETLNTIYDHSAEEFPKLSLKTVLSQKEAEIRQDLKKEITGYLKKYQDPTFLADHVKELFFNAVATGFDPHTEYFSPKMKNDFETALSSQSNSFGFLVYEKDGKVMIQHLLPGGPAWKSGDLHKNDELLQISLDAGDPVDLSGRTEEEVSMIIEMSNAISLKVKKGDGSTRQVSLRKETVSAEESKVKGFVIKGEKKIGYISLPDFYTIFDSEGGSSCAEDVGKEIVNLKKEGIEGLILDVRYNGGGSLHEALQLIGIFIESGPLLGVRERNGKVVYLKDPNRGTIYDGPMVVLVNGQSASASEALAASLQDYNRAVIVGSDTYGKGSMQQLYPIDTNAVSEEASSPHGFVKITIGKFYRLNGGTVQKTGVRPDISLPDAFSVLEYRETFVPNVLSADSIARNNYYKPLTALPLAELKAASGQRVQGKEFESVRETISGYLSMKSKQNAVPLKLDSFEAWRVKYDNVFSGSEKAETATATSFVVANHQYEAQRLSYNSYAGEINSWMIRNLKNDVYIREAFNILSDLIQLHRK